MHIGIHVDGFDKPSFHQCDAGRQAGWSPADRQDSTPGSHQRRSREFGPDRCDAVGEQCVVPRRGDFVRQVLLSFVS